MARTDEYDGYGGIDDYEAMPDFDMDQMIALLKAQAREKELADRIEAESGFVEDMRDVDDGGFVDVRRDVGRVFLSGFEASLVEHDILEMQDDDGYQYDNLNASVCQSVKSVASDIEKDYASSDKDIDDAFDREIAEAVARIDARRAAAKAANADACNQAYADAMARIGAEYAEKRAELDNRIEERNRKMREEARRKDDMRWASSDFGYW